MKREWIRIIAVSAHFCFLLILVSAFVDSWFLARDLLWSVWNVVGAGFNFGVLTWHLSNMIDVEENGGKSD